jgi:hypothetical protein
VAPENKLKKFTGRERWRMAKNNVDCNLNNKFFMHVREEILRGHCRGELIIYNQNGNSNLCGWTEREESRRV